MKKPALPREEGKAGEWVRKTLERQKPTLREEQLFNPADRVWFRKFQKNVTGAADRTMSAPLLANALIGCDPEQKRFHQGRVFARWRIRSDALSLLPRTLPQGRHPGFRL